MIDKRLENQNVQTKMKKNFSHTNTKGKGKVWSGIPGTLQFGQKKQILSRDWGKTWRCLYTSG
jgi:hypothetical protein